jgi:transcriptional regulator with XRE-family HTH domain
MEIILPIFSVRLKALRKEQHLTQKAMAGLIGRTERHYQAIEAGTINVSATMLLFLADYFHVSVDYLLGLREDR